MVGYSASVDQAAFTAGLTNQEWYDVDCCYELPYVCQIDASANPTLSAKLTSVGPVDCIKSSSCICKTVTAAHYQCPMGDGEAEAQAFVVSMSLSGTIFTLSLVAVFWCLSAVAEIDD